MKGAWLDEVGVGAWLGGASAVAATSAVVREVAQRRGKALGMVVVAASNVQMDTVLRECAAVAQVDAAGDVPARSWVSGLHLALEYFLREFSLAGRARALF